MKNSKIIALVCTVINITLIIICAILYFRTDREKPEFKLTPSDVIYSKEIEKEKLMQNINAMDNHDGDVTKRIVIEKILENKKDNSAVVFYAVSDSEGNVAKISRVYPAEFPLTETETTEQTTEITETQETDSEETTQETDTTEETESLQESESSLEQENSPEQENLPQPESTEPVSEAPLTEVNPGKPSITLKETEITTSIGTPPAWVKVIQTLSDDKDNYEKLFANLSVSKYDLNKAGKYKVILTTKDSQGNVSDPVSLTINVK